MYHKTSQPNSALTLSREWSFLPDSLRTPETLSETLIRSLTFIGFSEVRSDMILSHFQNVPAVAAILALKHLTLNMFYVDRVGTLHFSLLFILLNINV